MVKFSLHAIIHKVIKLEIVLVRHGETTANTYKLIQGWTDNPLNEAGILQAHEAGKYLKSINYKPDVAYTSPLSRAYDTGEIILSYINHSLSLNHDFHFIERNFGPFEHHEAIPTLEKVLVPGFDEPGFESDKMIQSRVLLGLKNIYKYHKGEKVIIFCHSHTIKSCLILAEPETYTYKQFINNGSIHKIKFDGEKIKVLDFHFYP